MPVIIIYSTNCATHIYTLIMGFGSVLSRFFDRTRVRINSVSHNIGESLARDGKVVSRTIGSALHTGQSAVTTVYKDARSVVSGVGQIVNKNLDRGYDLANHVVDRGGDTVSSLGRSLSLPLLLGAGLVGVIYLGARR